MTKKIEGEKEKTKRTATKTSLTALVGKTVKSMTKAEQESLLIIFGQALGLLDADGKVKAL
jgi:hypothetical protein